ncbi:TrkH family potassium uptake protein [Salinimicrobium sediminilitoris]|uniref:TrkH family potassium uptake protein n=1 Tax=Salinimicrobium sediminilitoris TaxID=2876715 RepID=UPI001E388546|nr:TrkH family potassium uptake protein [Salinimicrobium sediminilitoris]MCC8360482.1 TrkH family potassium uptake protein [Salinimicrobium sediminilitoris]
MGPSLSTFLRDIGKLLHIPAGLAILSLPVIISYSEWFALGPFAGMALVSVGTGQLFFHLFKAGKETSKGLSVILVALAWLLISLFGIIPFYGIAMTAPAGVYAQLPVFEVLVNSMFESVSGFTGTGLTMLDDPSEIPYSLQWWRSFSEWIGGIGVIMLASLLLKLNHDDERLYHAETRHWEIKDAPVTATIQKIWWIYIGYTLVSILLYYFSGMPFWEALNHGMTALGTGGFSVTSNSFTDYTTQIKALTILIMVMGAIAFKIHYLLVFQFDLKRFLKQTQLHYFFFFLVAAFCLLLWIYPELSIIDLLFQATSALATCGLNTVELGLWPMAPAFVLVILMLLGANAGSTGGGIKTVRFAWFAKGIWRSIKQVWFPEEKEAKVTFDGEMKEPREMRNNIQQAANVLFLWVITLTFGTFFLSLSVGDDYTFYQILFDTASALSNVGLSTGVTGAGMPENAKYLLSLLMWLGRLEIMAIVILIISPFYLLKSKVAVKRKE